jgi:hypothetical protein
MAAAAEEALSFLRMNEAELRQWVKAHPERINDKDSHGYTSLTAAATRKGEGL